VARGLRQMARSHGQVRTAVLALAATAVVALGAVAVAAARRAPESTSAHETTVRQAVSLWRQFPVEGAGLANFGYVHGQPPDRSSAQSFPFTILAEQGLIGLLVVSLVFWGPGIRLALRDRGLEATPLAMVFLVGGWFYDFPLALDVCAVWLGILVAAFGIPALGLPPARIPAIAGIRRKRAPR
jgi:hypothetical protein